MTGAYYRKIKMDPSSEPLMLKWLKIAGAVSAYWVVSISMVFLNKYLLSSDDLKLDAPIFVTWFQCLATVFLCLFFRLLTRFLPKIIRFPEIPVEMETLKQILPLSAIFVCMIIFNNLCLKYVGVAFYYVGRSLTTVFNVIFSYLILRQGQPVLAMTACGVIIGGFFLGVDQEGLMGTLSIMGVVFGVLASSFVALNAITTKKLLPVLNNDIWRLSFYNNLIASFLFLPLLLLSGEITTVMSFGKILDPTFWLYMCVAGCFGFIMGYVVGLQIQLTSPLTHNISGWDFVGHRLDITLYNVYFVRNCFGYIMGYVVGLQTQLTSPLTHNISGTAKACAQTIIATAYYHDVKPYMWWMSNAIVMAGSCGYTEVKRREMMKRKEEESQASSEKPPNPV